MEPAAFQPAVPTKPATQRPAAFQPQPVGPAGPRPGLFADEQRPVTAAQAPTQAVPEPARHSLFSTMTDAFRRRGPTSAATAVPQPQRREPVADGYQDARASVRQTSAAEEAGIEIPAFLRRQSS
jgi:cell division protein FtsZ